MYEDRLVAVMTAPLDSLVAAEAQVIPPAEAVQEWRLLEQDLIRCSLN